MQEFQPITSTTRVFSTSTDWTWEPNTFESCVRELAHASAILSRSNHLILYRGQQDRSWLLDSTIARSLKQNWLKIPPDQQFNKCAQNTLALHRLMVSAVLWKFRDVMRPKPQLLALEKNDPELDSWFEYMKRLQQHPDKETDCEALPGTPLVDWSSCPDIGMFFANRCRKSSQSGAIFIADATEMGPIQMTKKVVQILDELERTLSIRAPGLPVLFCPTKQIKMLRAKRQSALYLAHMDLRYDLGATWRIRERNIGKRMLLRLILPAGTGAAIANHLHHKGLDESYVMVNED